jgi:hypothetical protein
VPWRLYRLLLARLRPGRPPLLLLRGRLYRPLPLERLGRPLPLARLCRLVQRLGRPLPPGQRREPRARLRGPPARRP